MPLSNASRIEKKIKEVAALADEIPGVIVIHELPEFVLRYMSDRGLQLLGKQWDEIKDLSNEEYHKRFFNAEDAKSYVPKILGLLANNTGETVSYFQQVRTANEREWDWYMSMTKILLRDSDGHPLLCITTAMQIDPQHYFTSKAVRLLKENEFLKKNYDTFTRLSHRERDVLRLLVLGKSANEIASELYISVTTAETHRRNIKKKLNTSNSFELGEYARAFDLI